MTSIQKLLSVKGGEYAGSDDRLANFKRGAFRTGCTPLQVLWVYLSKHIDSVETFVRDEAEKVTRERSEPIDGRLDDIINYCLLAKALIKEGQNADKVAEYNRGVSVDGSRIWVGTGTPGPVGPSVQRPYDDQDQH